MLDKRVHRATLAVAVVAIVAIAYLLGSSWNGRTPGSESETAGDRLARLDQIEARLGRLEKKIVAVEATTPADAVLTRTELTTDGVTRGAALESAVSELKLRISGLEEDPIRRGYSFLASDNVEMRREGVNILARAARVDPEARAAIRGALADPSARVREQAAQMLGDLRDGESASELKALLTDSDARTRRRAIQGLGAIEAVDAAQDIGTNLVLDADPRVREAAARALRRLKPPEAEQFFIAALQDQNASVRGQAIAALGEIGATSAVPNLRAMYEGQSGPHRLQLVRTLKLLGDEGPLAQEVAQLSERIKSDPDERARRQAISELASLARASSREIFVQALQDPSAIVRAQAERALR